MGSSAVSELPVRLVSADVASLCGGREALSCDPDRKDVRTSLPARPDRTVRRSSARAAGLGPSARQHVPVSMAGMRSITSHAPS